MVASLAACGNSGSNAPTQAPAPNNDTSSAANNQNSGSATVASGDNSGSGDNGGSGMGAVSDKITGETQAPGAFDATAVSSKIGVEAIVYTSSYTNSLYLLLTNNSGVACDVSGNVDFYDKSDKIVGTKENSEYAFAPGTTIAMRFDCDDEFKKYEYTISAKEPRLYNPVDQDLSCEVTTATKKAIISVTNNGKETAEFVEYTAFYYAGDKLVATDWGFVGDSNSQILAGATQKDESHCYEDFDSVKVYLHGRSDYTG